LEVSKLQALIDVFSDTRFDFVAPTWCEKLVQWFPSETMLDVNLTEHMVVSVGLMDPVHPCTIIQLERLAEWDILHEHPGSVHGHHLVARVQHSAILALGNVVGRLPEADANRIVAHLERAVQGHLQVAEQAHQENSFSSPHPLNKFVSGQVIMNHTEINLQRHHSVLLDSLSNTGNRSDPNTFLAHLRHPDHHHPLVRESAAFGLRHHGSEDIEQVLAAHALKDPHPVVRRSAMHAYENQPRSYNLTHIADALQARELQSQNVGLYNHVTTNGTLFQQLENHDLHPHLMHTRARRQLVPEDWLKKLSFLEFELRVPGFSWKKEIGNEFLGASIGAVSENFAAISVIVMVVSVSNRTHWCNLLV
jgi:hypothetical protein